MNATSFSQVALPSEVVVLCFGCMRPFRGSFNSLLPNVGMSSKCCACGGLAMGCSAGCSNQNTQMDFGTLLDEGPVSESLNDEPLLKGSNSILEVFGSLL